jgi:hypothetical protein
VRCLIVLPICQILVFTTLTDSTGVQPDLPTFYSPGEEILKYLEGVATKYDTHSVTKVRIVWIDVKGDY